jgi:hypothetical protein
MDIHLFLGPYLLDLPSPFTHTQFYVLGMCVFTLACITLVPNQDFLGVQSKL